MLVLNFKQNSDEWFDERKGDITGSRSKNVQIEKIISKTELVARFLDEDTRDIDAEFNSGELDKKEYAAAIKVVKNHLNSKTQEELEARLDEEEYTRLFHKAAKKEYWRILAEKAGYSDADDEGLYEDPRERGHRLEDTAAEFLEREYNIQTVKVGMLKREDYNSIAVSPDRMIVRDGQIVDLDEDGFITNISEINFVGAAEIKNPGVANHLEIVFTNEVPDDYWLQVIQYFVVNDELEKLYFVSHNENVTDHPLHVIEIYRKDIVDEIELSFKRQVKILEQMEKDVLSLTF